MDHPCCVGVVRDPAHLKGTETTLSGVPLYYTKPSNGSKKGVVVIHDIFGFSIPNTKYIVDHLATKGFVSVAANFYHRTGPWSESDALDGDKWNAFYSGIITPEFWTTFLTDLKIATDFLHSEGCDSVGVIGFCWGGKATAVSAASDLGFKAAVSLHGAGHSADDVKNAHCPFLFLSVPNDFTFSDSAKADISKFIEESKLDGGVKIFDGVTREKLRISSHNVEKIDKHKCSCADGFVVRGDFSNAEVKAKADEAMEDTVVFLSKNL